MGLVQMIFTKSLRRAVLIGAVLHMGQQMSGMNALIIYSADMFASSTLQAPDTDLVCLRLDLEKISLASIGVAQHYCIRMCESRKDFSFI
jgi:hypothetical protein